MQNDTLKTRVLKLLQKSRQAFRLYASWGKAPRGDSAEFTEMQAGEWRNINAEIIKELTAAVERPNLRETAALVLALRDRFLNDFRFTETEMHTRQKELVNASEKGDFVKAAIISRQLVVLKARTQATQAAQHEIDELVSQSRISASSVARSGVFENLQSSDDLRAEPIALTEQVQDGGQPAKAAETEEKTSRLAPVIPLRKRVVG